MAGMKIKKVVAAVAVLLAAGLTVLLIVRHAHRYQGPSHFPKSVWVSAGTSEPVSALETACWAALHGDGATMLASLTPELQDQARKDWEKKGRPKGLSLEDYLAAAAKRPASNILGFRVLGLQVVDRHEVLVHVFIQGWWHQATLRLRKIGPDWKVAEFRWG